MTPIERTRAILRATDVSYGKRLLLIAISDYQGMSEACWPSQKTLAEDIGTNLRQVRRWISELAADGWLERTTRASGLRSYAVTIPHAKGENHPRAEITLGCPDPVDEGENHPRAEITPGRKTTVDEGEKHPDPRVKNTLSGRAKNTLHGSDQGSDQRSDQDRSSAPEPSSAPGGLDEPTTTSPPSEAFDVCEYHPAHPTVESVIRGWRTAWSELSGGSKYVMRGPDHRAAGQLAHWIDRRCFGTELRAGDVAERIAEAFCRERWGARRPAMSWLNPESCDDRAFDPEAWLGGPPSKTPRPRRTRRGPKPVSPIEDLAREAEKPLPKGYEDATDDDLPPFYDAVGGMR